VLTLNVQQSMQSMQKTVFGGGVGLSGVFSLALTVQLSLAVFLDLPRALALPGFVALLLSLLSSLPVGMVEWGDVVLCHWSL
jgi:hypothetical protein